MTAPLQDSLFETESMIVSVDDREKGGFKAGPKAQVETSAISWRNDVDGVDSLQWFAEEYLTVPRGQGAGAPMQLENWQLAMAEGLYSPRCRLAVWVLPRGQGKSGIAAAIALHRLFDPNFMGSRLAIVAQDERSARRLLKTAVRMVELNPALSSRAVTYRDHIVVPGLDAELTALPAEAHRVEGSDLDLAILDEIGFMTRATFEAAVFSVGKVAGGKALCIGTPSPAKFKEISPLWDLVNRGRSNPDDPTFSLVEYGAPSHLDIHSRQTWRAANPALGSWLTEDAIRAQAPPITRELEFRRARLGQWVDQSSEPAFTAGAWRKCARKGVHIPKGAKVILALDGSVSGDSTAIVVGSVSKAPHFQIGGLWEPHKQHDDYEVSHLEVEDKILELAAYFNVMELTADPFRWQRTLQVLEEQGLNVSKFPQTAARLTPATNDVRAAVNNGLLTHSDEEIFNQHALRASVEETTRGLKLGKPSKNQKIDLAACLVMGYSRASWLGGKKKNRKVKAFRK